jgi:hypothetical protein
MSASNTVSSTDRISWAIALYPDFRIVGAKTFPESNDRLRRIARCAPGFDRRTRLWRPGTNRRPLDSPRLPSEVRGVVASEPSTKSQ